MVDAPDDPAALRRRAGNLRALADRIDRSVLHDAARLGGDDVWRGPAADDYRVACRDAESLLGEATAALRGAARRLEQTANDLGVAG
jgi:hypothetical protein